MSNDAQPAPRLLTDLTEAQADGLACVECGADFATAGVSSYPVGVSETGSQVFACTDECAALTIVRGLLDVAGRTQDLPPEFVRRLLATD